MHENVSCLTYIACSFSFSLIKRIKEHQINRWRAVETDFRLQYEARFWCCDIRVGITQDGFGRSAIANGLSSRVLLFVKTHHNRNRVTFARSESRTARLLNAIYDGRLGLVGGISIAPGRYTKRHWDRPFGITLWWRHVAFALNTVYGWCLVIIRVAMSFRCQQILWRVRQGRWLHPRLWRNNGTMRVLSDIQARNQMAKFSVLNTTHTQAMTL